MENIFDNLSATGCTQIC